MIRFLLTLVLTVLLVPGLAGAALLLLFLLGKASGSLSQTLEASGGLAPTLILWLAAIGVSWLSWRQLKRLYNSKGRE